MVCKSASYAEIEDLVLLRSDGHPLYNLSVVIDDIEMGITHVIRGQDHLTNTHKQILIYEALGATVAAVCALAADPGAEQRQAFKTKTWRGRFADNLSRSWICARSFRNFLALLGWSPARRKRNISRKDELMQSSRSKAIRSCKRDFQFSRKRSATLDRRQGTVDERRVHSHDAAR